MASAHVVALQTEFQALEADLTPMQDVRAAVVAFIEGQKAAVATLQAQLAQALADIGADAEIVNAVNNGVANFNLALDAEREALASAIVAGTPAEPPPAE